MGFIKELRITWNFKYNSFLPCVFHLASGKAKHSLLSYLAKGQVAVRKEKFSPLKAV
jgi:hypothetical protein